MKSVDGWQPIATAPRDGTAVLLFSPGIGRWIGSSKPTWRLVDERRPTPSVAEKIIARDGDKKNLTEPTHWRHLPPPPDESLPSETEK
jgi:hypothetical protein